MKKIDAISALCAIGNTEWCNTYNHIYDDGMQLTEEEALQCHFGKVTHKEGELKQDCLYLVCYLNEGTKYDVELFDKHAPHNCEIETEDGDTYVFWELV